MAVDLSVSFGALTLSSPVMAASGTFGSGVEAQRRGVARVERLGAVVAKTVTQEPRSGNPPLRMAETASGMLNSIGLQNPGIDAFLETVLPAMRDLPTAVVLNVAGRDAADYAALAARVDADSAGVAALELNLSCPNVSKGLDLGRDPSLAAAVVTAVRATTRLPLWVKLTPNVTDITAIAQAVEAAGADALTVANTVLGLAVDWRRRAPRLAKGFGGLSGPAIKPIALRLVATCSRAVSVPIIGCGGIQTADDALEFIVAGAHAVQVGTASFADPDAGPRIVDDMERLLAEAGVTSLAEIRGSLSLSS